MSNAVDAWWREAGEPDRFVIAEHGAGPGTLARTVTAADGACLGAGALEWVMVERSDSQRLRIPRGIICGRWPTTFLDRVDVVFANELLDNLAFDIVQCGDSGWFELRVGTDDTGFVLVGGSPRRRRPALTTLPQEACCPSSDRRPTGCVSGGAVSPSPRCRARLRRSDGALLERVASGCGPTGAMTEWSIGSPIPVGATSRSTCRPSSCGDRIADHRDAGSVPARHGIDALVEEGRRAWEVSAHVGDLAALRARSRLTEAGALLDPAGMGSFLVVSWPSRHASQERPRPTLSA